ncbi:hypothetical protein EDC01DRAFT_673889 [Geopyxis carbonaria]|nr:hypothetical protein EDC01DRAFT_673889 [Geopyxis carbonaria]
MSAPVKVNLVNAGTFYRIQKHPFTYTGTGFPTFDVEFFKQGNYIQSGVTTDLAFSNTKPENPASVYGGTPINTEFMAINHFGIVVPTASGQYTISAVQGVDDIVLLWLGAEADNGKYTRDNAEYEATYGSPVGKYKVDLEAGKQYSFRILMANAQGPAILGLTYSGPGKLW